jgi:hypothetical protein
MGYCAECCWLLYLVVVEVVYRFLLEEVDILEVVAGYHLEGSVVGGQEEVVQVVDGSVVLDMEQIKVIE